MIARIFCAIGFHDWLQVGQFRLQDPWRVIAGFECSRCGRKRRLQTNLRNKTEADDVET